MKATTVLAAALLALAAAAAPAAAQLPGGIPFPVELPAPTRRPLPYVSLVQATNGSVVADWAGVKACKLIEAGGVPDGWALPRTADVVERDGGDWAELDHTILHWSCELLA